MLSKARSCVVSIWKCDSLLHTRLCAHPEISPESNSVPTLQSSSDEAINRSISIRMYMQKDHVRMLKTCSPCRSLMDYGNTKITQHALKSVSLKTARVAHYTYRRRRILWKTKKGVGEGEEEDGSNSPVKQRSHHLCHRPPA